MFSDLGYTARAAANGADALELLAEESTVDLLFTDVTMPGGMCGTELATRARELYPNLRVLYTTGFAATGMLQREMLSSGAELLGKPYTAEGLAATARRLRDSEVLANG